MADDAAVRCDHEGRDFYLEVRHKDGGWGEWPNCTPICEACARQKLETKMNELLSMVTQSESFKAAWGSKSVPLRYRSRDGRIIDQDATVN